MADAKAAASGAGEPRAGSGPGDRETRVSGDTVTVACKLPNGLHLQLATTEEVSEPVMGGGWKTVRRSRFVGMRHSVHGSAFRIDRAPAHAIIGGYGLTPNVPADFFAQWLEQNADLDAVRNNLVFALSKPEGAAARAREQRDVASGLEPISPSKLPRGIATATDKPI